MVAEVGDPPKNRVVDMFALIDEELLVMVAFVPAEFKSVNETSKS